MKKFIIILGATLIIQNATLERDFFQPNRKFNIIKDQEKIGTIERDFFQPNRKFNIYQDGQKTGTIERDYFDKEKWRIKKDD